MFRNRGLISRKTIVYAVMVRFEHVEDIEIKILIENVYVSLYYVI